jgi:short-subunit dehydrogenase
MEHFKDKTAFITGAASGIGLALAKAFAGAGSHLMLADINADALKTVAADIKDIYDVKVETVRVDTGRVESVNAAVKATLEHFPKVHFVINNAGVSLAGRPGQIPAKDWQWITDINLLGLVYGVEGFVPHLLSHGEPSHIVNTASMAGHMAMAGMAPYHATKFAAVGYSEALAQELASTNIGVSVLCPTWVKSNIHNTSDARPTAENAKDNPTKKSPLYKEIKSLVENGMEAETLADLVLKSIAAKRLYIFNDPEARAMIDVRRNAILKDYDACLKDLGM